MVELTGISIALAMDCFAVSLSAGACTRRLGIAGALRIAFLFGGFQSAMALLGWLAAGGLTVFTAGYSHWIAFALLVLIGAKMLYEAAHEKKEERNYCSLKILIVLAFATSMDSFAAGAGISLLKYGLLLPVVFFGAASFVFSLAGVYIGGKAGEAFGSKAEAAGGIILILLGVKILLEHM